MKGPSLKIVVATIGSRGDVQPYINLCQGLQQAGHTVTLATNPTLCPLAEAHGVPSRPVGPAVDMGEAGARLMAQSFGNMWIGMIRVMQLGAKLVEQAYPDVLELCRSADLVITSDTTSGIAEAEKLGVPWISVTLQPARIPLPQTNPGFFNRVFGLTLGKLFVAPTNAFRKRVGAPPVKDISSMLSQRLIILPVSPQVAPPDPRWPAQVRSTGYWFARHQAGWAPPPRLAEFLGRGERPVAVSLGVMSLSGKQARQGAEMVLEGLRQAGVRAVVQGWEEVLKDVSLPETVYLAGSLPHAWLFDQVSAVVHHGGFGTTAAVLRAGVPGIIVPHIIDQFYWGQRIFELGVGPQYIPRQKLSAPKLAQAISQAQTDPRMRARAAALGGCIRTEPDGVSAAVRLIEQIG
jgi:UDP:flavonoid glycosyltransferase YjiC (YdhE family)